MTRQEHLRSQLVPQTNELARLKFILLAMKDGTDESATEILARLRMGASVEQLCGLLEDRPSVDN